MSSVISQYAESLITALCNAGLNAKRGFLAQFVEDIQSYPFIALQNSKESNCKYTDRTVTADRNMLLLISVCAGFDQDDSMDSALLSVRRALMKGKRILHLGESPVEGKFSVGEPEYFIPEGADHLYVCQVPITIQYTDTL